VLGAVHLVYIPGGPCMHAQWCREKICADDWSRNAIGLPQPSTGMRIASRTSGSLARAAIGCIYPAVARQAPRAASYTTTAKAAAAAGTAAQMEVLQPASVFKYFHELTQLPRPSKHEHRRALHAACGSHMIRRVLSWTASQ
jgi:hypothetical protein